MSWFAYHISPIDIGWENLKTVKETIVFLTQEECTSDNDFSYLEKFLQDWSNAKKLASEKRWEGDFRHEPCVFWLPYDVEFAYSFVFKQDNNGSTFIVSPYQLPYLDEVSLL